VPRRGAHCFVPPWDCLIFFDDTHRRLVSTLWVGDSEQPACPRSDEQRQRATRRPRWQRTSRIRAAAATVVTSMTAGKGEGPYRPVVAALPAKRHERAAAGMSNPTRRIVLQGAAPVAAATSTTTPPECAGRGLPALACRTCRHHPARRAAPIAHGAGGRHLSRLCQSKNPEAAGGRRCTSPSGRWTAALRAPPAAEACIYGVRGVATAVKSLAIIAAPAPLSPLRTPAQGPHAAK
jgi:hypothetical protein